MSNQRLMVTAEVARMLCLSPRQVARKVKSGDLFPSEKLPGRRGAYLFDRAYIERIAARDHHTTPERSTALADHDDVKAGA